MTKQRARNSRRMAPPALLFGSAAQAAVNDSDTYRYDPTFNGAHIIDDRFARGSGNRYLAQKLV